MHVPVAPLGSWNAAWRLVFKGGAAGIVWQSRQAWFSEASGFCGRLGWWQDVQAMPRLPVWFSWSKVTAPSFAGSVILSLGRCAAGRAGAASCGAAGFSACVVGGGAEVAVTGVGGACGCVACVVTGAFGAAVAGGRAVAETAGADVPAGGGGVVVVPALIWIFQLHGLPREIIPPDGPNGRKGYGFGIGGAVLMDPAAAEVLSVEGELSWGGAAGTYFWIDRNNELAGVWMVQRPPFVHEPSKRFKVLTYQALEN